MAEASSAPPQAAVERPPSHSRTLIPREHGAYVELAFSLATALLLGGFGFSQILFAVAAITVFLAHEPMLVLLGQRGKRALGQFKKRALDSAVILLASAAVSGAWGWRSAPGAARAAVLLPLSFAALLALLIVGRREKTAMGELLVALTFATGLIPVALAGGVSLRAAVIAGSTWTVVFLLQTSTVRCVTARANVGSPWRFAAPVASSVAAVIVAWILSTTGVLPFLTAAALLPTAVVAAACGLLKVPPRHLRALGWCFAGSNLVTISALVVALR